MDQRANVEQDIKDIVNTRVEISRKMQLIDQEARYELENMKAKWSSLSANMGTTGKEFIERSARVLNPARQMHVRPWVVLGSVVLVGCAVGLLEKNYRRTKVYPYYPPQAHGVSVMPSEGHEEEGDTQSGVYPYFPDGHEKTKREDSSLALGLWNDVKKNVSAELQRSKEAVGHALREFARDLSKEIVPIVLKTLTSQSRHRREDSSRFPSS